MRSIVPLLFVACCLFSCKRELLTVHKSSPELQLNNGLLTYKGKPFTGELVAMYNTTSYKLKTHYTWGRKDGLEKKWFPNGQLSQRRTYVNGTKVGKHLGWWDNGNPKFEYYFNDKGAFIGNRKEWYKNHQLVLDFNYVDGKEQGKQRMWDQTGKIRANYDVVGTERFGLIGLKKCYTVNINSNALD